MYNINNPPITKYWLIISVYQTIVLCLYKYVYLRTKYHCTNRPRWSTPIRKESENHWIIESGITMPYDCNMNIKGVGNTISPDNNDVTVINLFSTRQLINCNYGRRNSYRPKIKTKTFALCVTFDDLISCNGNRCVFFTSTLHSFLLESQSLQRSSILHFTTVN